MKAKNRSEFKAQWTLHLNNLNHLMWNFDVAEYPDIYNNMRLMLEEARCRVLQVIDEASLHAFPSSPEDTISDLEGREANMREDEKIQADYDYEDATEAMAEGDVWTAEEIQADYEAEERYHATENYARAHYTI